MSILPKNMLVSVIAKIAQHADLSAEDREALLNLPFFRRSLHAGEHIARQGDPMTNCCALVSGFACRYKILGDGRRQIIAVHIPGDFLDLHHILLGGATHNLQMLAAGQLAMVPKNAIEQLISARAGLQRALWLETLLDASILGEWVANIGRRDALSRIAHLLCEFATRMRAVGLIEDESFTFPLSQEQIADATGLTSVHVNRTLQTLRRSGLIRSVGRTITIDNWAALAGTADFDPAYLRLPPGPGGASAPDGWDQRGIGMRG